MVKSDSRYKLKIIAGLHQDAEMLIDSDVRYCIGAGDDCDIILLDSGVSQRHLFVTISQDRILLEPLDAELFVDGTPIAGDPYVLTDFDVVTLGQAHLAIGPADEVWPPIAPSPIKKAAALPMTRALVPVDFNRHLPQAIKSEKSFKKALEAILRWISLADKKMAATACAFLLALSVFVFDTWRTCPTMATVTSGGSGQFGMGPAPRKSMLLTMVNSLSSVQRNTLVGAGLAEPTIPTQAGPAAVINDPVDHIRHVLKTTWGPNLTETRTDDRSIQFKGFDRELAQQNLVLNLEQNEQGQIKAQGVTLTPKKKKAILSHLGDIIRVKVEVSEDMESVCKRVMEKKGVRRARARFNIEDNTFTLQGRSDRKTIAAISDIVAKAFPNIVIDNKIKTRSPKTAKLDISGVSTSGAPHVILQDGSKVFNGGKLENGCTIVDIENDYIMMSCYGMKRKHNL